MSNMKIHHYFPVVSLLDMIYNIIRCLHEEWSTGLSTFKWLCGQGTHHAFIVGGNLFCVITMKNTAGLIFLITSMAETTAKTWLTGATPQRGPVPLQPQPLHISMQHTAFSGTCKMTGQYNQEIFCESRQDSHKQYIYILSILTLAQYFKVKKEEKKKGKGERRVKLLHLKSSPFHLFPVKKLNGHLLTGHEVHLWSGSSQICHALCSGVGTNLNRWLQLLDPLTECAHSQYI